MNNVGAEHGEQSKAHATFTLGSTTRVQTTTSNRKSLYVCFRLVHLKFLHSRIGTCVFKSIFGLYGQNAQQLNTETLKLKVKPVEL